MPSKKRGAPRLESAPTPHPNPLPKVQPGTVAENRRYTCPNCGTNALDITRRNGTVLIHCLGCGGGLDEVHEATGIEKWRLLTWPPPDELGPTVSRSRSRWDGHPEDLPAKTRIAEWATALLSSDKPLTYLLRRRGLTVETVRRYELGYAKASNAITIPVRDESGKLVNLRRRLLGPKQDGNVSDPKMLGLGGRGSQLYPLGVLESEPAALVVSEGEFDCLLLNQHGIPALTGTAGRGRWDPDWSAHLVGRKVAVLYDAGALAYELAEQRALDFRSAGARDAWPVDLTLAGFREDEDVTNWFVDYRWSARELVAFINETRRIHRRERNAR
jgi:hypothetical protein